MYRLALTILLSLALSFLPWSGGVSSSAYASVAPTQLDATKHTIELASGPLSDALIEVGAQLKVSIFFSEETVKYQLITDIIGEFTLETIFKRLLLD